MTASISISNNDNNDGKHEAANKSEFPVYLRDPSQRSLSCHSIRLALLLGLLLFVSIAQSFAGKPSFPSSFIRVFYFILYLVTQLCCLCRLLVVRVKV